MKKADVMAIILLVGILQFSFTDKETLHSSSYTFQDSLAAERNLSTRFLIP